MRKSHTQATKLAAVFLAQQSSVEAAAEAFGIDPRTISKWTSTVELPADKWTAIRDVLQARGAEMAARGQTTGLSATLTGAGIADRNVRYGVLIARRDTRRAGQAAELATTQEQADRRQQRQAIRDELDPHYWLMPEAKVGGPRSETYKASIRRFEYARAVRRAAVEYIDREEAEERGEVIAEVPGYAGEPNAAEHITGGAGLFYLVCMSVYGEGGTDPNRWCPEGVTPLPADDAPDDEYRAFFAQLIAALQAEADAWWPHYTAELKDGMLAERLPNGRLRIRRHGRSHGAEDWHTELPYELDGLPILDATPEKPAIDVTPPRRIVTAEPPSRRVEPSSDPADGVLVDVGEPWQWRPWDG